MKKLSLSEKIVYTSVALAIFVVGTVTVWEKTARTPFVNFFTSETVTFQSATTSEVSDFELFIGSQEAQEKLKVLYEQHLLDIKQEELKKLQDEVEIKKEELRSKELGL